MWGHAKLPLARAPSCPLNDTIYLDSSIPSFIQIWTFKPAACEKNMDICQRIALIIFAVSGAGLLAYCASDDIFLTFAQKHWRHDMRCGRGAPSPATPTQEAICNPAGICSRLYFLLTGCFLTFNILICQIFIANPIKKLWVSEFNYRLSLSIFRRGRRVGTASSTHSWPQPAFLLGKSQILCTIITFAISQDTTVGTQFGDCQQRAID